MKKIIIVPSWIKKVMARERMSVKDVLSYTKLCELLSPEDIKAFFQIQSYGAFRGYQISESDSCALLDAWRKGLCPEKAMELDSIVNLSADNALGKDYLNFLISGANQDPDSQKTFDLIPADHYTLLLVLNDGYFGAQDYDVQDINIVENILRVLYGEFVQEEVARTSIFKRYVNMLGKTTA